MVYTNRMYSIQQLAKMAGITRRTLHYYDEIGLLKPSRVGENGYRYYGEDAVLRLQQILFYRELELPLEQIRLILADPNFDPQQALKGHKAEIQKRIQRLERLIQTVDHTINHLRGEQTMDDQQLFDVFNEDQQAEYQKEAQQLYDAATVRASYQRWNRYTKEENAIGRLHFSSKVRAPPFQQRGTICVLSLPFTRIHFSIVAPAPRRHE